LIFLAMGTSMVTVTTSATTNEASPAKVGRKSLGAHRTR
jgi:hypothetical protein